VVSAPLLPAARTRVMRFRRRYHAQIVELLPGGKCDAIALEAASCLIFAHGFVTLWVRYTVEFVDYSERQATDKEHVRVPKSEQVVLGARDGIGGMWGVGCGVWGVGCGV
jgi:hypothetical protein